MIDYHVHTRFSGDSSAKISDQLKAAAALGLSELCFTDHIDFDNPGGNFAPADLSARHEIIKACSVGNSGVTVREGAEISMAPFAACARQTREYLAPHRLDFIIGSVHVVDGVDVYYPEYHEGKRKEDAYLAYLEAIVSSLPAFDFISVLGHYDFVAKYAPYPDRSMSVELSPLIKGALEAVFKAVLGMGKGIEINTAAWRDGPRWGLDVLKLYRSLGGEFVTFGSDAHRSAALGNRLNEARELAIEAGIPYFATFSDLEPTFHPIEKC